MNNIIRREPIYRKIPNNDDTRLLSINNFKGLQVFDNPLLADMNSTFSCKNVYRDEVGNLTLRPRIVPDATRIYNENIKTIKTFSVGTFKVTKSKLYGPVGELTIDNDTNVLFQEFDNTVYVVVTQSTKLKLYKYQTNTFVKVDGDIPLVVPENQDISSYNLLNNQISFRDYYVLNQYPNTINDDMFETKLQTSFENEASWSTVGAPTFTYHLINKNMILFIVRDYNDGGTLKTVIYSHIYNTQTNTYDESEYILDTNFTYTVLDEDSQVLDTANNKILVVDNSSYVTIIGYDNTCKNTYSARANSLIAYKINIPYDGSDISIVTKTLSYTNNITPSAGFSAIIPISEDIAFVRYSNGYVYNDSAYNFIGFTLLSFNNITTNSVGTLSYKSYVPTTYDSILTISLLGYSNGNFALYVGGQKTGSNSYKYEIYNYSGQTYNLLNTINMSSASLPYISLKTAPDLFLLATSVTTAASDYIYTKYVGSNYSIFNITGIYIKDYDLISNNSCFCFIKDNMVHTVSKDFTTHYMFKVEYVGPTSYTLRGIQSTLDGDNLALFYNNNALTPECKVNIVKRNLSYLSSVTTRETDKIPYIDEIVDKPVTTFYLDNTYWFITQHHIFGTGVSKGKLTIDFWDPMKYFKITEKITGAIRISDTSFWVFHNNGAYLIYKTTEVVDGVSYTYWLITNTAKSKGCDFENALTTLPISNNIATVTNIDICTVQMRKYIQSDERTLVPITLTIIPFIQELLEDTANIKIGSYKYLTLFCFNRKEEDGTTPVLVYDNQKTQWYYWELPVDSINQLIELESNIELLCKYDYDSTVRTQIFTLSPDYFEYRSNHIIYDIYCDKIQRTSTEQVIDTFRQIDWYWESAIQTFKTTEYRKQLLFTNFILTDYNERIISEQGHTIMKEVDVNFDYYFGIYSQNYTEKPAKSIIISVSRAKNLIEKTNISNFSYLQILLKNQVVESDDIGDKLTLLNKPKFTGINLKYRLLSGVMT